MDIITELGLINKQIESSERAQSLQKISNFGKLASQTNKSALIA